MMSLRIIEPERPGFDSRTFECPKCYDTETFVASISREINVSIGPSLAGAQAASALPARYTPLSTFRLGKGKEAQRAVYDSNDDIA